MLNLKHLLDNGFHCKLYSPGVFGGRHTGWTEDQEVWPVVKGWPKRVKRDPGDIKKIQIHWFKTKFRRTGREVVRRDKYLGMDYEVDEYKAFFVPLKRPYLSVWIGTWHTPRRVSLAPVELWPRSEVFDYNHRAPVWLLTYVRENRIEVLNKAQQPRLRPRRPGQDTSNLRMQVNRVVFMRTGKLVWQFPRTFFWRPHLKKPAEEVADLFLQHHHEMDWSLDYVIPEYYYAL